MKTIVYVDGFSLYLGAVRTSSFKWLNLESFFTEIIKKNSPDNVELIKLNYFTSDIKSKFSTHGRSANISQQTYLRALSQKSPEIINIIKGMYFARKGHPMKYQEPPDKNDRVEIWQLEEKQTDVKIALQIYHDVIHRECEQIVICSNDTDIIPALEFSRKANPELIIGAIFPRSKNGNIPISNITEHVDWHWDYIDPSLLQRHQLPNKIPTRKRPILKPDYW